ncbi:MAG: DUF2148 domain-containing protein [Candidatus Omnitrophica bacterium]|nr:DUF2148 domain-containing protein [Candidatus Omnitrophota bacterium]
MKKIPEHRALEQVAEHMCLAARTAPKAKGVDNIITLILKNGATKNRLLKRMREIAEQAGKPGFSRDADNAAQSPVIVFIGTKTEPLGITYCGLCGFDDCAQMTKAKARCAFSSHDLGIAVGSAVSIAADFRVDNRIMYSLGKTAVELNLFNDKKAVLAMGIPLSATGKNIFFDRK